MGLPVHKVSHLKTVSVRLHHWMLLWAMRKILNLVNLSGTKCSFSFRSLKARSTANDVAEMLRRLEPREDLKIIRMRFGLDGDRPLTLEEVGAAF